MLKPFLPLALFAVLTNARTLHADIVIEQKVESAALHGEMVLKIRADQARMDMPGPAGQMTVLWNFKTGEMTTLMAAQKMAMKGKIRSEKPGAGGETAKPKPTGVKEKVGPYAAEVYEVGSGPAAGKIWVAKDYPNAEALKTELRKMSDATPLGFGTPSVEVPGMVVKSQVATPAGPATITLTSARQQAVPDSDFAIPAGYKEMSLGPMNGAASAAAATPAPKPVATIPAAATPAMTAKAKRHWEGRFKELDTNGDGKLPLEEFLHGPMARKSPAQAKTFFQGIDKQNAGSITLDQWLAAHGNDPEAP